MQQSNADFELIVVDDGSTDDTPMLLSAITDSRVRVVTTENVGAPAARNAGSRLAVGRYLTFLDSDDEAYPQWLATFARLLEQHERCGIVCCGVVHTVAPHGRNEITLPSRLGAEYDYCTALFMPGSYCVRRDAFVAVDGFVDDLPYGEHHELALRLVPYCLSRGMRVASTTEIALKRHIEVPRDRLRHYRAARYAGAVYVLDAHRARLVRNRVAFANYSAIAGVSAAALGKMTEARKHLLNSIRMEPRRLRNYVRLAATFSHGFSKHRW